MRVAVVSNIYIYKSDKILKTAKVHHPHPIVDCLIPPNKWMNRMFVSLFPINRAVVELLFRNHQEAVEEGYFLQFHERELLPNP